MNLDPGEPYGDVRRARVRAGELRQHDVYMLDQQRTLVLGVALGPPRLWSYLLDVALGGFVEGYEQPHDGRAATRLHQGLRGAQQRLRTRAEAFIERQMPDVGLLALGVEGAVLHVLSAGPLRAFLHQQRRSRRLGPREEAPNASLLKGASSWSAEQVGAGDLLFAGSLTACSASAVDELDQLLATGQPLAPQQVVEQLNRAPAANGTAALAVAMRVPSF
jgi:hypothetical protein